METAFFFASESSLANRMSKSMDSTILQRTFIVQLEVMSGLYF